MKPTHEIGHVAGRIAVEIPRPFIDGFLKESPKLRDWAPRLPHRVPLVNLQKISATVLTYNSERRIDDVLSALDWCDEVIVLDAGSSDGTLRAAERHRNVVVHSGNGPFPGFGKAHRCAVARARNDWILSVDSDEVVSIALAEEICGLRLSSDTVYAIPFHNYFNGRLITSCGWFPDRHARLFNRRATNFCESEIHETVGTDHLGVMKLSGPIQHFSYEVADDFLRKMRTYSQLFAGQYVGQRDSGPGTALWHGVWAFVKSYLIQRGCFQGYDGMIISAYKAQTAFWKYLYLYEANRERSSGIK